MATEVTVPVLGESITEATLGEWLKQPGDPVAVDEPIASLETDKVSVEVPSPVAGVMGQHAVAVGDTVQVGAMLAAKLGWSQALYASKLEMDTGARLARVTRYFHSYRVAGQKSVPEIWVTGPELQRIQHDLENLLNPHEDRLHIIALDPRQQRHCLGQAQTFNTPFFSVV